MNIFVFKVLERCYLLIVLSNWQYKSHYKLIIVVYFFNVLKVYWTIPGHMDNVIVVKFNTTKYRI
jgi:hypothetical protein